MLKCLACMIIILLFISCNVKKEKYVTALTGMAPVKLDPIGLKKLQQK